MNERRVASATLGTSLHDMHSVNVCGLCGVEPHDVDVHQKWHADEADRILTVIRQHERLNGSSRG